MRYRYFITVFLTVIFIAVSCVPAFAEGPLPPVDPVYEIPLVQPIFDQYRYHIYCQVYDNTFSEYFGVYISFQYIPILYSIDYPPQFDTTVTGSFMRPSLNTSVIGFPTGQHYNAFVEIADSNGHYKPRIIYDFTTTVDPSIDLFDDWYIGDWYTNHNLSLVNVFSPDNYIAYSSTYTANPSFANASLPRFTFSETTSSNDVASELIPYLMTIQDNQDISSSLSSEIKDLLTAVNSNTADIDWMIFDMWDVITTYLHPLYDSTTYIYDELSTLNDLFERFKGNYDVKSDLILSKLDDLIVLLSADGMSNPLTQPNMSVVDQYENVEASLINDDNFDIDDIELSLDTNALSFVWGMVTDLFNTNPVVMGTLITLLVIGLIALILGRG